tara:strand:- start:1814 stop:2194 length:381 start_codon:yes stop_codon:yes gene_type:complete
MSENTLNLEATARTPEIRLSHGRLEIKGECYPEDVADFASSIMPKILSSLKDSDEFKVYIKLFYFNSSTAKFLYDFFENLDDTAKSGKSIEVNWLYESDDDSMEEAGQDFAEDMENLVFNLLEGAE